MDHLDINKDKKISYLEFIKYHHLIPISNLKDIYDWIAFSVNPGESLKLSEQFIQKENPIVTVLACTLSGVISWTITAPLERIKVIMQASEKNVTFLKIWRRVQK